MVLFTLNDIIESPTKKWHRVDPPLPPQVTQGSAGLLPQRHQGAPRQPSPLYRPPPVLALASVQTANHIDGFVFKPLNRHTPPPLQLHCSITSSCSVGATSRNPRSTSPEMFWKTAKNGETQPPHRPPRPTETEALVSPDPASLEKAPPP